MTGLLLSRFAIMGGLAAEPPAPAIYVGGKSVSFAGTTTTGTVGLTDLAGGIDTAARAGDYVVVAYAIHTQNRTPALTISGNRSGSYDVLAGPVVGNATFDTRLYVFGKLMGTPPDTQLTRSATGNTGDSGSITIHVWRAVDPTTPLDVAVATASGTPARPNPPSITPETAGAQILAIGAGVSNAAWTAGYLSEFVQSQWTTSNWIGTGIGSVEWTGGAYDPAAWTDGYGAATYAAVTLALRPTQETIRYVGGKTLAFAGDTTSANISLTDLAGGIDTEPSEGDYVVVAYNIGTQNRTPTLTISGDVSGAFDVLAGPVVGNDDFDARLYAFGKRMGASPDTQITRSGTGSTADAGAIVVHVWRGVDAVTPMDVTPTTANDNGGGIADPPSITPATAGAVILAMGGAPNNAVFTTTELANFLSSATSDSVSVGVGMGSHRWTSGAFNPAAFSGGSTIVTSAWAAITLALRPEE